MPTICIDFDGTIADYSEGYRGPGVFGDPLPGAVEAIQDLKAAGWRIIILTTRDEPEALAAYFAEWGIPYDHINEDPESPPNANRGKPLADVYLDDRAVRFVDWEGAVREIEGMGGL